MRRRPPRRGRVPAFAALALVAAAASRADEAAPPLSDPVMRLSLPGEALELRPADIGGATVARGAAGEPVLHVALGPGASAWLAEASGRFIGAPLSVEACGRALMAPVVRDRIASGTIVIAGLGADGAQALAGALRGRVACPPGGG